jgi:hypothetical protein
MRRKFTSSPTCTTPQHLVILWRKKKIHQNLYALRVTIKCMGFRNLSDMMANIYSISCKMQKWPKKLFFHLVDLTIQNMF